MASSGDDGSSGCIVVIFLASVLFFGGCDTMGRIKQINDRLERIETRLGPPPSRKSPE